MSPRKMPRRKIALSPAAERRIARRLGVANVQAHDNQWAAAYRQDVLALGEAAVEHQARATALERAWRAFLDDDNEGFDALSEAVRAVIGWGPSPMLELMRGAKSVPITELPLGDREFGNPLEKKP